MSPSSELADNNSPSSTHIKIIKHLLPIVQNEKDTNAHQYENKNNYCFSDKTIERTASGRDRIGSVKERVVHKGRILKKNTYGEIFKIWGKEENEAYKKESLRYKEAKEKDSIVELDD